MAGWTWRMAIVALAGAAASSHAADRSHLEPLVLASAQRLLGTDPARPMYVAGTSVHLTVHASAICPLGKQAAPGDAEASHSIFYVARSGARERSEHVGAPRFSGSSGGECSDYRAADLFNAAYYVERPHHQVWEVRFLDSDAEMRSAARRAAARGRDFIVYQDPRSTCVIEVMTGPGYRLHGTQVTLRASGTGRLRDDVEAGRACLTRAALLSNGLMGARTMADTELASITALWREGADPLGNAAQLIFQTKVDPGMSVADFRKRLAASPRLAIATGGLDAPPGPPPQPIMTDWSPRGPGSQSK